MVAAVSQWIAQHALLVELLGIASAVMFVGTLLLVPVLIACMRADYFVAPGASRFAGRHPVLRWTLQVLKNVLGAGLLLVGIAMLVLPGQGILTILIGLTLLEFPGKRAMELAPVRRRDRTSTRLNSS